MDSSQSSSAFKYNDPSPMSLAGRFPRALTGEDPGDGFLYKGSTSPKRSGHGFQRKPPHIDMAREYEAAGKSYKAARNTIAILNERHRQLQITQEEAFERDQNDRKFTANFAETRLATCGIPTLNSMNVRIDRQRLKAKDSSPAKLLTNKKLREAAHRAQLETQIRAAVRRSYGSQELDLKSLELVHIPRAAVFSTLLLQLARTIRTVNVSRNALRELPDTFVQAFPEVETLIYKENALARLPAQALGELRYLRILNISGNQLDSLPLELPETLEVLDASRNRLQEIQNLHLLTKLVTLDASYNHFQLLPCGLVSLHKLQTLILAGNRLVSLATRPQLSQKPMEANPQDEEPNEDEDEAERKQWRVEMDPISKQTVYFHLQSKRVTRTKPKCFQLRIPKLQLPGLQQKQDTRALLDRYPGGWEIVLPKASDTSTALQFVNHCTGESFSNLPPDLDRWDGVDCLHTLVLSGNELLEFPPSIGKLKRLKRLEAENNKLLTLPDVLQGLSALETLKLGMNGLSSLPPSFSKLQNLTEADIKLNRLEQLPAALGDLQQLRVLDVSANALKTLPKSFLALKRIVTLRISGNTPLLASGFAIETLRSGNLAEIRWQLEHQIECEKHGGFRPPEPKARLIGIGAEVWSTDLHINREFVRAVELAQETHTLSMHWRGIDVPELPRVFFTAVSDLRELRLSGQKLEVLTASFGLFTKLRLLQLRQNGIRTIEAAVFGAIGEDSVHLGIGTSLENFDLRYNRLELLPDTFTNCVKLQVLRASHNVLNSLPDSLDGLSNSLVDLQLAHNQLTTGPRAISALKTLERLDLSFNHIDTLEDLDFSQLIHLQVLRLSGNRLTELPMSLGGVGTSERGEPPPIRELSFAGNLIQDFPPAVLLLGATLQRLEMQSNRFERLPMSFGASLPALESVESDGNPFRSPPAEVMRLGARAIRLYLYKRDQRVEELAALLTSLGLDVNREVFDKPIIRHLIPDALPLPSFPFLTSKHLLTFDRAVDRYVNGAFYLPRPLGPEFHRGADIFHKLLLKTHFELAQQHHRTVLEELLQLLTLVRQKRWADKSDLRYDMLRPWGRHGELVGVYMVRGSLLFPEEYQTADESVLNDLPSVLKVVETRTQRGFPPEPFIESKRTLRDVEHALEQYAGHYGPVGVAHANVPMRCACEELLRFGKMHDPCEQPGWTMVRVLYTEEEVLRREQDEKRLQDAQDALLPQIRAFLETPEGEKRFQREVRLAKEGLRAHLRLLKKQLKRHQAKLKPLLKEHEKEEKMEKKLEKNKNKSEKETKKVETLAELKARVAKKEKFEFAQARVREDTEELEKGKIRLGQGHAAFRHEVEQVLLEKVGATVRQHLVRQQRDKAIAMGWRRPWDGVGGRAFERYQREILRHKQGGVSEEGAAAPDTKVKAPEPDEEEEEDMESDNNSEVSDVSFDGYEDLVANLGRELLEAEEESEEEDEEGAAIAEAARAAALAALEAEEAERDVDDLEDSSEDEEPRESEDSDL
ncbi:Leucine-rich repeat-containing protein 40 [Phytophthora citrophthora]|uniref:Leucine-rich repeat-containing protein 40 n=1 Tax=Phytophthora citrophthora TaxID=4793 RepID=A0AAD9LG57_9STRA|nr:Leucine-rich repeat-containing protein 40 [Phytophthora citrophthora]